MRVIKRDGSEVEFNIRNVIHAISQAEKAVYDPDERWPADHVVKIAIAVQDECLALKRSVGVEEIQDMIERHLMVSDHKDTAKAYIIYREGRAKAREEVAKYNRTIGEKLRASNVQNQNANVDEMSFGGRRGEAANEMMKQYALEHCMSEMSRKNHENNEIYIHDLDSYAVGMHNCLSVPLDDLLANGFNTRQTDVRPASSINTAFQLVAVLFQLQSLMQFGGVSATHLDWTMVPYVRKSFYKHWQNGIKYVIQDSGHVFAGCKETPLDDYPKVSHHEQRVYEYAIDQTTKELKQAVEGMYHNLNTLQSRSGNQLPFSSINYGTCTSTEGRMVTKALLEGSIEGVGKLHRTSVFPCCIFQCMNGVNRRPGDPNYDMFKLALKSTSLRLYPNYVNVDWSGNVGYDPNDPRTFMSTMGGCKSQLM